MKRFISGMITVGLLLTAGGQVIAHEGHDHRLLGTVTMAAADHVMIKDKDGKGVTVLVTKDTKVKSKPTMTVAEIKTGTRVAITASQEKDKPFVAKTIEVGTTTVP